MPGNNINVYPREMCKHLLKHGKYHARYYLSPRRFSLICFPIGVLVNIGESNALLYGRWNYSQLLHSDFCILETLLKMCEPRNEDSKISSYKSPLKYESRCKHSVYRPQKLTGIPVASQAASPHPSFQRGSV